MYLKLNSDTKYKLILIDLGYLIWSKNSKNTPTGASTNPKNFDLNKNLNLIIIEIEIWNWNLEFECQNLKFGIWNMEIEIQKLESGTWNSDIGILN